MPDPEERHRTLEPKREHAGRVLMGAHLWIVVLALVLLSLFHYMEQLGVHGTISPSARFGLTRHGVDRLLFLLPMVYATFTLGFRWGVAIMATSGVIMLPRALWVSPTPPDALLEVGVALFLGLAISVGVYGREQKRKWYEDTLRELEDVHKRLQHYVGVARGNEQRLATMNSIFTALSPLLEPEEIMRKAVAIIAEQLQVELALVYTLDEEHQLLTLGAHEGVSEDFVRDMYHFNLGEGFIGRVAQTGEPLLARDASQQPRMDSPSVRQMRIETQVVVPMDSRGRAVGVLCVAMRRPREFLPAEVDMITTMGNQLGVLVDNAQRWENERRIAEELRVSERKYRQIFERASDAIWLHDLAGDITAANVAAERLTGYTVEELTRMNVRSLLSEESLAMAGQMRRELFKRGSLDTPYNLHLYRKDGTSAILKLTSGLIRENRQPLGFLNIARDATEETRLQESMEQYLKQVTQAQEEERRRIARELHDDTMQALYGMARQVDNFLRANPDTSREAAGALRALHGQTQKIVKGIQRFNQDLRPPMLDELGFLPSLRWLLSDVQERSDLETVLTVTGEERRFSPEAELTLFRVVQEALRNVERHAQATRVEVSVRISDSSTTVVLTDNGIGFTLDERVEELPRSGKLGLAGMHERVRLIGGTLHLTSEPNKGTAVEVTISM